MKHAVVDYYRVQTGLPWIPGGVAVVAPPAPVAVRYAPDEIALPSRLRFVAEMGMLQDAIDDGLDPAEAITRITGSGFSGHLSWQVTVEVPDGMTLNSLYAHYVEAGSQDLPAGARAFDPVELPFG